MSKQSRSVYICKLFLYESKSVASQIADSQFAESQIAESN